MLPGCELLTEARALGFLGPGPLEPQIHTPRASPPSPARLSGGRLDQPRRPGLGRRLPGLVVATDWPEVTLALLEAHGRRAAFLRRAVERLGLADRVTVLEERAEVCRA